jgi:transcription antitermination factor NusG
MPWLVAKTQSRREQYAYDNVVRQGRVAYCPMFKNPKTNLVRPLFSSYIFVLIDDGLWWFLRNTFGVFGPIMGNDGPAYLQNGIVESLRKREDKFGYVKLARFGLANGQPIKIIAGPLLGQYGLYEGMASNERCRVLLTMLGRSTIANVDVGHVEAVPPVT